MPDGAEGCEPLMLRPEEVDDSYLPGVMPEPQVAYKNIAAEVLQMQDLENRQRK